MKFRRFAACFGVLSSATVAAAQLTPTSVSVAVNGNAQLSNLFGGPGFEQDDFVFNETELVPGAVGDAISLAIDGFEVDATSLVETVIDGDTLTLTGLASCRMLGPTDLIDVGGEVFASVEVIIEFIVDTPTVATISLAASGTPGGDPRTDMSFMGPGVAIYANALFPPHASTFDGELQPGAYRLVAISQFGWEDLDSRFNVGELTVEQVFVASVGPVLLLDCTPAGDIATTGNRNGGPDGIVNLADFACYLASWSIGEPSADITATGSCAWDRGDGMVDLSDFSCYLSEWTAGCDGDPNTPA
ncbi:MAG: GC-type dockerin domain-anchored protein [Planctomycetota bacterium]